MVYRRVYDAPTWRRVRILVLRRDNFTCRLQSPGCRTVARHVHHKVRPEDGGAPFDPQNLLSSCAKCNIAERNSRRAEWARIHNGEEQPAGDIEVVRSW